MLRIANWLFGATVLAGLAWTGWWYALSQGQQAGLDAWFEDRAAQGWQAEYSTIGLTGYPLRLNREITGIRLADNTLIMEGAVPAALLALAVQGLFDVGERWLVPRGLRLRAEA